MKKIKTQNNKRLIAIALVLLMVISIGYAALTTTLTINGTANIGSSSWLVYFTNVVPNANNNVAQVVAEPSTTGKETTTLNFAVNMDTPGQKYEFTVDVVNEGSIDAMIATETENLITQGLSTAQKKYLDYSVTYINGAPVEKNDKLSAGETKTLKVKLEFKTDVAAEDLPQDAETISLSYSINYVQADGSAIEKNTKFGAKFVDTLSNKTHSFGTYSQVTKIERALTLPETYKTDTNKVSTEDSFYPIYMWNENNVLYWYSEAEHPKLPSNSSGIFGGFSNLTDASGINDWDTSNATNMNGMFNTCNNLTSLDISNLNTLNVTDMSSMFNGCNNLKEIIVSDNFIVSNVENSTSMFSGCSKLVGGNGTVYNSSKTDKTMANIDTEENPGYLSSTQQVSGILSISDLRRKASMYFGYDVVNYANTLSTQELKETEWQLFYAGALDGENDERIYLISKNYVKNTLLPEKNGSTPVLDSNGYYASFEGDQDTSKGTISKYNGSADIIESKIKKLNKKYFDFLNNSSSENKSMKAVAYMLDTNIWSNKFAGSYAEYAIGGPTIELLFTGYNLYAGTSYQTRVIDDSGYEVSYIENGTFSTTGGNVHFNYREEYNSPYSVYGKSADYSTYRYCIASPVGDATNVKKDDIFYINDGGSLGRQSTYSNIGFRPIVCLDSSCKLQLTKNLAGEKAFQIIK